MSDFARQQGAFQRGILTGDNAILDEILDSPKAKHETLFGIYRHAYGSRLVEVMRNDHELLHRYLGDEVSTRWGMPMSRRAHRKIPTCAGSRKACRIPQIGRAIQSASGALRPAALEKALNEAFDAAEAPVLALGDMAASRRRSGTIWCSRPIRALIGLIS